MAIIKCKMCGGDLEILEGSTVCECAYCGTRQTVPSMDNEKKLTLFGRAGRLLRGCEFDKAAGVFETIVADFPEEAEAYWGLVLCKYGIEYVDDPATGKKVPTCHRSSFVSVLDDPNFEQACENTDAVARRVYRDEARAIEALREQILAVSGREEPYDVFISYKETDDNGERTLDSVLAQDIYKALTDEGYRVFFSRISLEDKLGTEYEPYIFAALNSAKVMLAVGTDYENYDSVWVKNEWSRFLKLIAKGEKKTLIPVFKNMDAYDMPKEFAKLAAQDMGKVGAMQDLVRGVEKILGKKKPVAADPAQTFSAASETNAKTAAALRRGDLALEDREWDKAKEFYDQTLTLDAECAEAYFGLALAEDHSVDETEYIRKRSNQQATKEIKSISIAEDRIKAALDRSVVPGFLSEEEIQKLFAFEFLTYPSTVRDREKIMREEQNRFDSNRNLSRALRFAKGETAERLKRMRERLVAELKKNIEQAFEQERKIITKKQEAYEAHLLKAEKKTTELHAEAEKRREELYRSACKSQEEAESIEQYRKAKEHFRPLGAYKDTPSRLEQCEQCINALAEEKRLTRETRAKARRKKLKRMIVITGIIAVAAIAVVIAVKKIVIPNSKYQDAIALMESEQYEDAIDAFKALEGYRDSDEKIIEIQAEIERRAEEELKRAVATAEELEKAGKITEAAMAYGALGRSNSEYLEHSLSLWDEIAYRKTFDVSGHHTVGLRAGGSVVAVGFNHQGQCNISDWKGIVEVATGSFFTVGLHENGTVVYAGDDRDDAEEVSEWYDIVAVDAGTYHTVGLRADGTVITVGSNDWGECDVSDWSEIVAISAGGWYTVGLRADGSVVAVGDNDDGECNVSGWADIILISAGDEHTVGLRQDGTVVAVGNNEYGQCNVSEWTDIIDVAAGLRCTIGLRSDGTVVAVGDNYYGQCDVSDWTDVVAVASDGFNTSGLKADGTVVTVGQNEYGERDTLSWKNIKLQKK